VTWQHAEATASPVGIAMIDIDYFKQYNDRFGHPGGDRCLQELAAVLTASARRTDIVARYGGEEFAVILPDTDLTTAWHVAERIRQTVVHLQVEHPASPTGQRRCRLSDPRRRHEPAGSALMCGRWPLLGQAQRSEPGRRPPPSP
jgi:diguanylate cyclase (GGDEF)-like protein